MGRGPVRSQAGLVGQSDQGCGNQIRDNDGDTIYDCDSHDGLRFGAVHGDGEFVGDRPVSTLELDPSHLEHCRNDCEMPSQKAMRTCRLGAVRELSVPTGTPLGLAT